MGEYGNLLDAKRKCMIMELEKGKETVIRLRKLMMDPVKDREHVSFDDLALQISRSFTVTLSMLSPNCLELSESTQIGGNGSICSGESTRLKKAVVNDRRGCYKRRKTSDSWVTVSPTLEDGHAWRKYGQKGIQNSQHPRCYYRCTNKQSQGCKALKQVQKQKEDPFMYQSTYFHHHTCKDTQTALIHIADPDPVDKNILSFGASQKNGNITPPIIMKEKSLTPSKGDNIIGHPFEPKLSQMDPWMDILVGSDFWLGHKPLWGSHQQVGSSLQSCGSTSFSGLDHMEVNQLDHDIDNIEFE